MNAAKFYAINNPVESIPTIGVLVWYSIADLRVDRTNLENLFSRYGLDKEYLPKPIKGWGAFRRATKLVERKTKNELGDGDSVAKQVEYISYLVREVVNNKDQIKRYIVKEIRNSQMELLEHINLAAVAFDKNTEGISFEIFATDKNIGDIIEKIKENYYTARDYYFGQQIRLIIKNIIDTANTISVRRSGAVYFIPKSQEDKALALQGLLSDLNKFKITDHECGMEIIPVIKSHEMLDMVEKHLQNHIQVEVAEKVAEILQKHNKNSSYSEALEYNYDTVIKQFQQLLTEDKLSPEQVAEYLGMLQNLSLKVREYEELLEKEQVSLKAKLEFLTQQATQILSKTC